MLSSDSFHALSKYICNAGFQRIIFKDEHNSYSKEIKSLLEEAGLEVKKQNKLGELIFLAHQHLLANYRHEYLYKAALLNSYILNNFSLDDTIVLNEFRIGSSKADAVLINGTNKVFEIKTELDSPERLQSQISDYYRVFSEVYIIVHNTQLDKYIRLVDEKIGVLVFLDDKLELIRSATLDQSKLDVNTMIRTLRKEEYIKITKNVSGCLPNVQPVELFKKCLEILSKFPAENIQREFLSVIKSRINPLTNELIRNNDIPPTLRPFCYYSNLNKTQLCYLLNKLNCSI